MAFRMAVLHTKDGPYVYDIGANSSVLLGAHSKGFTGMKPKTVAIFTHLESEKIILVQTIVYSRFNQRNACIKLNQE